ncbi:oligomeric golgi complex component, COG2-domain-containing protein [Flagelloscypha sp. PMI_526]|nr:oligomeric golgi complex component, COG2-domain-containing protein [Flagelloscypha sp. PMI_526]
MQSTLSDPYQLTRLAEELPEQALNGHMDDDEKPESFPDLLPLTHDNKYIRAESFQVEDFLLSRAHTSLPDLRSELREYLSTLKDELVKLINDDYEAFISLSTDLRGEGTRLLQLKDPLAGLKGQIRLSRNELQEIQGIIEDKLARRATLREEKALVHLLMKISESVTRLEALLLITSPSQDEDGKPEATSLPPHLNSADNTSDERSRGNRAKHLARVAAEYTQLLYHVSKARNEACVFVEEINWRVTRIQSTLSADLDHLFASILNILANDKGPIKVLEEKAKLMADLSECLRTYDVLHLWPDAEDVLRREIMRPFVKKTIHPGALTGPHSPIMPHTPFSSAMRSNTSSLAPYTPYTPFSASHPKTPSSLLSSTSSSHSPFAYVLAEGDDPLSDLYSQILRFVERDLSRIMLQAEKVSVKPTTLTGPKLYGSHEKGSSVGTPGRWGISYFIQFLNHEKSQAFLRSLEFLAPSLSAVEALRSHPTYLGFERRWQLPVYFQMRWKEVPLTHLTPSGVSDGFATSQAGAVWVAVTACWSAEVFIPSLAFRFWRLTLQILSRYKTWLENTLDLTASHPRRPASSKPPNSPAGQPRAGTPTPGESDPAAEDAILLKFSLALYDIQSLKKHVLSLWTEEISMMLPDIGDVGDIAQPEDALKEALSQLETFSQPMTTQIAAILAKRCYDALLPVKSIPHQFRAMSGKEDAFGTYFFGINVSEGPGSRLKDMYLSYASYVTSLRKTEESLRKLKKGKRSTFSLFGNSTPRDDETQDEERIRKQLILDVAGFGRDAQGLGVNVQQSQAYTALEALVQSAVDSTDIP